MTYQDDLNRLWLARADGSEQRLLTEVPVSEAVWSPHDSQIAYIAHRGDDTVLEIINVETGEILPLTSGGGYVEGSPHWTPDSAFLIFARYSTEDQRASDATQGHASSGIWLVPADGSAPAERLALTGDAIQVFPIR